METVLGMGSHEASVSVTKLILIPGSVGGAFSIRFQIPIHTILPEGFLSSFF